jgi:uncharacterized protein YjiK
MIRTSVLLFAFAACISADGTLRDYDLSARNAAQHDLPESLRELSGLTMTPDGRLLGHDDEKGVVAEIDPATGAIRKTFRLGDPAVRDDFEGIAYADGNLYLVTSAGVIYKTTEGAANASVAYERVETGAGHTCEIEGLAYDAEARELLLPCKTPRDRTVQGQLVILSYSLRTPGPLQKRVSIPLNRLLVLGRAAHPSSIEVHPRTGNLFVLSSYPQGVIEISHAGEFLHASRLSERVHPQPESIVFLPDLSIIIGDEGPPSPPSPPRITIYHFMKTPS